MKKINFELLVKLLTSNKGHLNGLKFQLNRKTFNFGFAKEELPGCLIIEDFERYYKFDAAKDYENPSEFVAECIIEEALNKIELEKEFNEVADQLQVKLEKAAEEKIAAMETQDTNETKPVEFRKELVQLMVQSLTTNLELCVCENKDSKVYCELLMDKLFEAYKKSDIDELDKLFGCCRKVLLEHNIISSYI